MQIAKRVMERAKVAAVMVVALAASGCEGALEVEGRTVVEARGASDVLVLPAWSTTGVSSHPLLAGVTYRVTVEGTVSLWQPMHWSSVCAGVPWPSPQLRSPGRTGPVGVDAEWAWAWPTSSSLCQGGVRSQPAPTPRRGLLFEAAGGGALHHLPPPFETGMTPDHVYSYAITGAGAPAVFHVDDERLADNYGAFRIALFPLGSAP